MDFVHLHVHSHYSLLDGLNTAEELAQAAKDFGQPGIAITDHGTLSSHRELQRAAKSLDIKPVLGVEAYISPTDRFDKRSVKKREDNTNLYNHIILLAKDQDGVANLNKMSEIAWTEGYYYKPRIDRDLLYEYRNGIIVLSGCLNGLIAKEIERGDMEKADELTRWFKETFDENFYMEVQSHNPAEINAGLLDLADKYGIKPVATSDCHYAKEEDKWVEEALLILSAKPKKNDEATYENTKNIKDIYERLNAIYPDRTMSFEEFKLFVQSRPDMHQDFKNAGIERTDIFDNTLDVLGNIGEYDYHENLELLPQPKGDPNKVLADVAWDGFNKRGLSGEKAEKRLQMELDTIRKKNFPTYFLVVQNLLNYCRQNNILVGPGRGSGAGSLLNYCLFITDVNPFDGDLLFARFINEERNDFPDIDVDIDARYRNQVKEYAAEQFKYAATVSNYVYFSDKGVIKDAARVYAVPTSEVNKALKNVDTFEQFETSRLTEAFREKYPEVLDLALRLRGRIRGSSMHAGGIVTSKEDISKFVSIETRKIDGEEERIAVVAADKREIAKIGLIKIDLLALKTLSVLADAIDMVEDRHGIKIDPLKIDLNEPIIYRKLAAGFTKGVFQAEATPYTNLLMKMGCDGFADLVASNALVRPGAMNTVGGTYIARKHGREQVKYLHPLLEPFTRDTYGVIIYQEQVMRACVELAGMSWSEADEIRSLIGKKEDPIKFEKYRDRFVQGAMQHISEDEAQQLWTDFEAHAGYSFNKSHAWAYSVLSYWTARFKHHYPHEYMTALLQNENDDRAVTGYLIEARRLGIKVLLPHVNESGITFKLDGDAIRIGLGNIKFITPHSAPKILNHRPFESYADLVEKTNYKGSGVNSKMFQAMNAIGAAAFDDNPMTGDELNNLYEYLKIPKFNTSMVPPEIMVNVQTTDEYDEENTFLLIGMVEKIKRGPGWALIDFVDEAGQASTFASDKDAIEKGVLYLFLISANRITKFIALNEINDHLDDPLIKYLLGQVTVEPRRYYVLHFQPHVTKQKKQMAYVTVANSEGEFHRIMVFEDLFRQATGAMKAGKTPALALARLKSGALFVKEIHNEHKLSRPSARTA